MKVRLAIVVAALGASAFIPAGAETTEQWIAKARARLGSEGALRAVNTIHFTGTVEKDDGTRYPLEIVFQKPHRQLITITQPKVIETTALDGYEAWQKRVVPERPTQWQLTLLDAAQIKRLRAQTWDNLNFFADVEKMHGTVALGGDTTVDGLDCVKLVFAYLDNMVISRFFEKATGRLVKTETETGTVIREEGEQIVNGVRFPRKITNREPSGKVTTILFDKIVLNENVPAGEFAVPALQTK